jgi:LPXTG-site transpeptidase (sortase) family protein
MIVVAAGVLAGAVVPIVLTGQLPAVGLAGPSSSPAIGSTAPGSNPSLGISPSPSSFSGKVATPSSGPGIPANRIQVARLGIDLRIVEGDGIDAPLGEAAHYPGSGWSDGGTNIYIYGHARPGIFLKLRDIEDGDAVVLTLVDGTMRTYIVDLILPEVPWDAETYVLPTPSEQLTLQTSTAVDTTAPRFIAIAHPAP